jgi:hypothetical protein
MSDKSEMSSGTEQAAAAEFQRLKAANDEKLRSEWEARIQARAQQDSQVGALSDKRIEQRVIRRTEEYGIQTGAQIEEQPLVDHSKLQTKPLRDYQQRRLKEGPSLLGLSKEIQTREKIDPTFRGLSFMDKVRRVFAQTSPAKTAEKGTGIPQKPAKTSVVN